MITAEQAEKLLAAENAALGEQIQRVRELQVRLYPSGVATDDQIAAALDGDHWIKGGGQQ